MLPILKAKKESKIVSFTHAVVKFKAHTSNVLDELLFQTESTHTPISHANDVHPQLDIYHPSLAIPH